LGGRADRRQGPTLSRPLRRGTSRAIAVPCASPVAVRPRRPTRYDSAERRTRCSWSCLILRLAGASARSARGSPVPSCLVGWRALIGVALAGAVWLYGTYIAPGGGLDDPCDFGLSAPEGSSLDTEWPWFPPGVRCVEERPNGTEREETYPGPVTFAVAGAVFVVPFLVRRRDRMGGPNRAGPSGDRA
jgi:hypothetical protein